MTTGDIKNNLRKLLSEIKLIQYPHTIDWNGITAGLSRSLLPILHYILLEYSPEFASFLAEKDYELFAKSDLKFVETVYKIFLQTFSYKPSLTKDQFFSPGFVERKIIFVTDVIKKCREKHDALFGKKAYLSRKQRAAKFQNNVKIQSSKSTVNYKLQENMQKAEMVDTASCREHGVHTISVQAENTDTVLIPLNPPVPLSSNTADQVPRPSPQLMLTPVKSVENEAFKVVAFDQSNAIVEDIESPIDNTLKPTIVRHENNLPPEEVYNKNPKKDVRLNEMSSVQQLDVSSEINNSLSTNSTGKVNEVCLACNGCNVLKTKVEELHAEFSELKLSLDRSVALNTELAARILLLETKSRLLEDRLNNVNVTSSSPIALEQPQVFESNQINEAKARTAMNNKAKNVNNKCGDTWKNAMITSASDTVGNYSPEKYMDERSSVPTDFLPLNLNELNGIDAVTRTTARIEELKANSLTQDVDDEDAALVSLCSDGDDTGGALEYFNTPLRNAVANVEKKLRETTSILKKSSVYGMNVP